MPTRTRSTFLLSSWILFYLPAALLLARTPSRLTGVVVTVGYVLLAVVPIFTRGAFGPVSVVGLALLPFFAFALLVAHIAFLLGRKQGRAPAPVPIPATA